MTIDRYTKAVLTVIAVALAVIAVRPYVPSASWPQVVNISPAEAQTSAAREATIPKSWGKFMTYAGGNLFLDKGGNTYNIVDLDGKPPEYPKLKWTIKFE
jgi:hypothetical protein